MPGTYFYKRSNFVTHLPVDRLYNPSHFWLEKLENGHWRVGFTKFATRMLGEIVDYQWEKSAESPVASGDIIGSVEGFKAISDLYCTVDGTFLGGNSALQKEPELAGKDPYDKGWLYLASGVPDARCIDMDAYRGLLDATIDRLLEKQQS